MKINILSNLRKLVIATVCASIPEGICYERKAPVLEPVKPLPYKCTDGSILYPNDFHWHYDWEDSWVVFVKKSPYDECNVGAWENDLHGRDCAIEHAEKYGLKLFFDFGYGAIFSKTYENVENYVAVWVEYDDDASAKLVRYFGLSFRKRGDGYIYSPLWGIERAVIPRYPWLLSTGNSYLMYRPGKQSIPEFEAELDEYWVKAHGYAIQSRETADFQGRPYHRTIYKKNTCETLYLMIVWEDPPLAEPHDESSVFFNKENNVKRGVYGVDYYSEGVYMHFPKGMTLDPMKTMQNIDYDFCNM